MPRVFLALAGAVFALASPFASSATARPSNATRLTTTADATIVLRGRTGIDGPWRKSLRLKLVRSAIPVSFTVCAVWGENPSVTTDCAAAPGERLPEGTRMRLEQHRKVGWRRVGLSLGPALEGVLSNAVAGNQLGTVVYRARLVQPSGRVLRTSNTFKVIWHK
jgi:hypothetical protein